MLAVGEVFAGFSIEAVLGRGGMGTVYVAAHPRLPRRVALKVLHPNLTRDDYVRTRFESEADHAVRLEHPNVVTVHDRGREGDRLWIAMQYVLGSDAGQALAGGGALDPARAVHIVTETAKALDYAHSRGVLHRDVKPGNILLEQDRPDRPGRVLLTDFGIAKALDESQHLTRSGMLVASLRYAAPEQFEATALDHRADVYSLGCTLFHLLTGRPPYLGTSLPQLMHGHLSMPIPHPSQLRPGLPPGFDAVIASALAKNREDRYPSCGALAAAAQAALQPAPEPASPPHTPIRQERIPLADTTASSALASDSARPPQEAIRIHPEPGSVDRQAKPSWWRRTSTMWAAAILFVVVGAAVGVIAYEAHRTQPPPNLTQTALPFSGLNGVGGVAVDTDGDLFVADGVNKRVLKLPAGSQTQVVLPFTGLIQPHGVAVDTDGHVFVTDYYGSRVYQLNPGSQTQVPVDFFELGNPDGIAVDTAGDLFVADSNHHRVLKLPAGSRTQVVLPFTDIQPCGVAVNTAGDIFVTEYSNNKVLKLPAGSQTQVELPFTGLAYPCGVAVDTDGDLFVTDSGNDRVLKLPAGSQTQVVLPFTGLRNPVYVAVNTAGDLFVTDGGNIRVLMLPAAAVRGH
ncbi:serine/threonine-protein kinase PknD [Nocardia sp. CA-119907]|uniref:serine/threonine-protein kinase PknD n=1 Tax=Nocardia sp. CA-119907 TaxID=3239973 RepID=UPI003D97906F